MMRKPAAALFTLVLSATLITTSGRPARAAPSINLQRVVSGLSSPVALTHAGDGSGRLFIVEQSGRIKVRRPSGAVSTYLNISSIVQSGGEQGLLGLAFPPSFETNGFLYAYYTNLNGDNVVARFRASPPSSNLVDPATRATILRIPHPTHSNHNGGQLQFGPGGNLFIATGDGGGAGDPNNNAQNPRSLLGKILRIDVSVFPYRIPPGNPLADGAGGNRDEIWHLGLRNPWRFSFDRATGDMFIGDVGQGDWEEIDRQPAGQGGINFGWDRMEGAHCYPPGSSCSTSGLRLPIIEYARTDGNCAVIGGYRYRGKANRGLGGYYLYADFCSGRIWGAIPSGSGWHVAQLADTGLNPSAFGEDEAGELYIVDHGGSVFRFGCGGFASHESAFFSYAKGFTGGVFVAGGDVAGASASEVVTGAGPGGGPHVRIFTASGTTLGGFMAYGTGFRGGVRVATGDVDGDGDDEIITGAGLGGGPHIKVRTAGGGTIASFMAYNPSFTGGVFVAAADLDADGDDEIITGAGAGGGPHVRAFDLSFSGSGALTGVSAAASFMAYNPGFRGGVQVGGGQLFPSSSRHEIVTGAGPGGGPHVKVFGATGALISSFFPYSKAFPGGVYVGVGDYAPSLSGQEVITGAGRTGGPHVRVIRGSGAPVASLMAYCPAFSGGVRVASANVLTVTSKSEIITGPGPGGGPVIKVFD
jgi:hypothetical protein